MTIALADLADPRVQELVAYHQRAMIEGSPPGQSFALDLSGLQHSDVTVWAVQSGERVAAIGALKRLDNARGEVKSMRTHPDFLRQGLATALLETIIAHALYRSRGFANGDAFADYALTEFNQCLHLALA